VKDDLGINQRPRREHVVIAASKPAAVGEGRREIGTRQKSLSLSRRREDTRAESRAGRRGESSYSMLSSKDNPKKYIDHFVILCTFATKNIFKICCELQVNLIVTTFLSPSTVE